MGKSITGIVLALLLCASSASARMGVAMMGGVAVASAPTISFVNSTTGSVVSGTGNLVLNKPTDTAEGDLMVVFISSDNTSTTFTLDGWTLIGDVDGSSHRNIAAYKIAGASEGADYTFNMSENAAPYSGGIITLRKSGGTWDIDQDYDEAFAAETTNTVTCPDMTATDNSMVLMGFANDGLQASGITSRPSGMTQAGDVVNVVSASISNYYMAANAGTVTGKSITWATNDDCSVIGLVIDLVP